LHHDALRALAILSRDSDVRALVGEFSVNRISAHLFVVVVLLLLRLFTAKKIAASPTALTAVAAALVHRDASVVRAATLVVCACVDDAPCAAKLCESGFVTMAMPLFNDGL
jgi:hypothetical protein